MDNKIKIEIVYDGEIYTDEMNLQEEFMSIEEQGADMLMGMVAEIEEKTNGQ